MTREEVVCIAEEFSEWLGEMAKKYRWDKDEIQSLIKQLLM